MEKELAKRKPTRLRDFNYNTSGAYFITICTKNREQILSKIVGGGVPDAPFGGVPDAPFGDVTSTSSHDIIDEQFIIELLPFGQIADNYIKQLDVFYDDIKVEQYAIMPNHIHIMLIVYDEKKLAQRVVEDADPYIFSAKLCGITICINIQKILQ